MLLYLGGIKPFAPLVDASSTSAASLSTATPAQTRSSRTSAASLSTATPAQTRSSRADDIEHGRYNDHDEEDRLPSSPMAYDAAAAPPIFWRMAIRTRTCRCKAPDSWQSSYEAGQPSRWSTPTCPAGITRSTCSSPSGSRTSPTESTPSSLGSSHDRGSRRPAPDK
jgi:hypothetical protein